MRVNVEKRRREVTKLCSFFPIHAGIIACTARYIYAARFLVRAAFWAASERLLLLPFRAAVTACLERAVGEAPALPSFFNAREVALDRLGEGLLFVRELVVPEADALPAGGGGSFTPALRAFDNPIAIACLALRTPCFPSLT